MKPTTKMFVHRLELMLAFVKREKLDVENVCPKCIGFLIPNDNLASRSTLFVVGWHSRYGVRDPGCEICETFMGSNCCPCRYYDDAIAEAKKRVKVYRRRK